MEESKGRVLKVEKNRAVVEVNGKRKVVGFRQDVNIKTGDRVIIFMNTIIEKK